METVFRGFMCMEKDPLKHIITGQERGRGVITCKYFSLNEYMCEFCTHIIHKSEEAYNEAIEEYTINEEVAYVLNTNCRGKLLHFDATRCYHQFGGILLEALPGVGSFICIMQLLYDINFFQTSFQDQGPQTIINLYIACYFLSHFF